MAHQEITKYTPEELELLKLYVESHRKISRDVVDSDLKRVLEDADKMWKLCKIKSGLYPSAVAIAHPQIDDKDPLRFFVTCNGDAVINPVITRHTRNTKRDLEGCLTFPLGMPTNKDRWYKIEAEHYTIDLSDGGLKMGPMVIAKLKGFEARFFQHEVDHLNGIYIYDSTPSPIVINSPIYK